MQIEKAVFDIMICFDSNDKTFIFQRLPLEKFKSIYLVLFFTFFVNFENAFLASLSIAIKSSAKTKTNVVPPAIKETTERGTVLNFIRELTTYPAIEAII